ncbi:hypothetical protein cyc_07025 [Cyclospora cayetanensis]|uniref:Uncharacterized protein n=1 Tax=Cyclospora cayetanensis TaxID=88456 RepID=A0A1D3DA88_9EIME|nr:hypothetical protein cyc_07025 [Cyclospora cayetanensis]
MRRASLQIFTTNGRLSDEPPKGPTRRSSGGSSAQNEHSEGDSIDPSEPQEPTNLCESKGITYAGKRNLTDTEPLALVSTPTRGSSKAKESGITASNSGTAADADQIHEKLQKMWDDGELSPRAPLDRSLGYFSSSSPNTNGRASGSSGSFIAASGSSHVHKSQGHQHVAGAPLFINDVRALRQMAPFSSTEEQVLTRSQRRRSSASLLQQLVASQIHDVCRQNTAARSQTQEDAQTKAQLHDALLPELQQPHHHHVPADGEQAQDPCKMVAQPVALPMCLSCETDSSCPEGVVSRGLGARKRRASSPTASKYSFSLHASGGQEGCDPSEDGQPRHKGRRYLSPTAATPHTAAPPLLTSTPARVSHRRISVGTAEPTSSSKSASTDFPVSSPISTSSSSAQHRNLATARQLRQPLQQGQSTLSATLCRRSACDPAGVQQQMLKSPQRLSPRRTRGGGVASSCHPFETPREPLCAYESKRGANCDSLQQRGVRQCPSSPAAAPRGGAPSSNLTADKGCKQRVHKTAGEGATQTLATELQATVASAPAKPKLQAGASGGSRRRASAVQAFLRLNGSSGSRLPSPAVEARSNREAEAPSGITDMPALRRASSPMTSRVSKFPWRGPAHLGVRPSTNVAPAEAQQFKRRFPPSALLTKQASKRAGEKAAEARDGDASRVRSGAQEESPKAATSSVAGRRTASKTRRSSALPTAAASRNTSKIPISVSAGSSSCFSSGSSHASAGAAPAPTAGGCSTSLARLPKLPRRKLAPCRFAVSTPARSVAGQEPSSSGGARGDASAQLCGAGGNAANKGEQKLAATPRESLSGKATPVGGAGRRLGIAAMRRLPTGKSGATCTTITLQRPAARNKVRVLPITKPLRLISTASKQRCQSSIRGTSAVASSGMVCEGQKLLAEASGADSRETCTVGVGLARQRCLPVRCNSTRRVQGTKQAAVPTADMAAASPKGRATSALLTGRANRDACTESRSTLKRLDNQKMPSGASTPSASSQEICLDVSNAESSACCDDSPDSNALMGSSFIPSSAESGSIGSGVSESASGAIAAQRACSNSVSLPPSKRRSSSPHNLALQKGASEEAEEVQRQRDVFPPVRRASSVCSLEDCERRVSAQQQKHEALHQEWEDRERQYQEKQQSLLLEQQRKEKLHAWEQREAELLKNRKALSKEEPSFWGFDPFMVDEEDERVLTTEELRVEVSRFLKGDLRFHSRADLLRVVKKYSEQTRTTTTTTSSRLNFTKVEQRVVPMAARQVHGTVPHERRRKSILRNSNGAQPPSECRRRSRGISFSPFNKVQLYMLDEHERASKEAAANLSQQGEQRQQLRQKLAQQFQFMLLRGDSDLELALIRRELANLYDPEEEDSLAFLSPTAPPRHDPVADRGASSVSSEQKSSESVKPNDAEPTGSPISRGCGTGGRLPFTVSPSWRQRPHGIWQESPCVTQNEPAASEWSPPPSPLGQIRQNIPREREALACWGTPIATAGDFLEGEPNKIDTNNDENSNCNAPFHAPQVSWDKLQKAAEEPTKLQGSEASRRPSVLSRRLSVVPNVPPH